MLTLSKSHYYGGLFEILKMFYTQKGVCESRTRMGSIWVSYVLIKLLSSRNMFWHFQNMPRGAAFLNSWKCFIVRVGGVGGWGGRWSFDPFNFVHSRIYATLSSYVYKYILKSCPDNSLVGLKFWKISGPGGQKSKSASRKDFFNHIQSSLPERGYAFLWFNWSNF